MIYDGSFKFTMKQIVYDIPKDFIDLVIDDFIDFEKDNYSDWYKNYKEVLTYDNIKSFFDYVITEMLSDTYKFEEYILTPSMDNIIESMDFNKDDFNEYMDLKRKINENLKYDSSNDYTVEQIVNNLSDDFIEIVVNNFIDFEKKNDKNWYENFIYDITYENIKFFFKRILMDMLSDTDDFVENILTPAEDDIVVEMDVKKDEFDISIFIKHY